MIEQMATEEKCIFARLTLRRPKCESGRIVHTAVSTRGARRTLTDSQHNSSVTSTMRSISECRLLLIVLVSETCKIEQSAASSGMYKRDGTFVLMHGVDDHAIEVRGVVHEDLVAS